MRWLLRCRSIAGAMSASDECRRQTALCKPRHYAMPNPPRTSFDVRLLKRHSMQQPEEGGRQKAL